MAVQRRNRGEIKVAVMARGLHVGPGRAIMRARKGGAMSEAETTERFGGGPRPAGYAAPRPEQAWIAFDRRELQQILDLYGRKVAAGEWRGYAPQPPPAKGGVSIFPPPPPAPLSRPEK